MSNVTYFAGGSRIVNATAEDRAAQAPRVAAYWAAFWPVYREHVANGFSRDEATDAAMAVAIQSIGNEGLRVDELPPPAPAAATDAPYVAPKARFAIPRSQPKPAAPQPTLAEGMAKIVEALS